VKRWAPVLLAAAALRLLGCIPAGTDVAELLPVQAVCIAYTRGAVSVRTDGGLLAEGATLEQALEKAELAAEGVLFFSTAEHVILLPGAQRLARQLPAQTRLRPAAKVYLARGQVDPETAARYLDAHAGTLTIARLQAALETGTDAAIPILRVQEGGLLLEP